MPETVAMTPPSPIAPVLAYFAAPGSLTDLGAHAASARALPDAVSDPCRVVQGLMIHPFLAHLHGVDPGSIRLAELETRPANAIVDRTTALDPAPLGQPRPPRTHFLVAADPGRGVAN